MRRTDLLRRYVLFRIFRWRIVHLPRFSIDFSAYLRIREWTHNTQLRVTHLQWSKHER